jgi:DNA-binding XRE family transcriptional regulator
MWLFRTFCDFERVFRLYLPFSRSTWHIGTMTTFELATDQMKGLRCSFPPYYTAAVTPAGWPVAAMPGATYEMLERGFAPTAGDAQVTLFRLRQKLRWSRPMLAAYMGVNRSVLRRWETGERKPSGAARRLIWLLDLLTHEPDKLKNAMDLIVWGRGEECLAVSRQLAKRR